MYKVDFARGGLLIGLILIEYIKGGRGCIALAAVLGMTGGYQALNSIS